MRLGEEYDIEIVEGHHRFKKECPAGRRLALADAILKATGKNKKSLVYGRHGAANPATKRPDRITLAVTRETRPGKHTVDLRHRGREAGAWACGYKPRHIRERGIAGRQVAGRRSAGAIYDRGRSGVEMKYCKWVGAVVIGMTLAFLGGCHHEDVIEDQEPASVAPATYSNEDWAAVLAMVVTPDGYVRWGYVAE